MVDELLTAEPVEGRAGLWPGAPPSPPLLRLRWEAAHSTLGCGGWPIQAPLLGLNGVS